MIFVFCFKLLWTCHLYHQAEKYLAWDNEVHQMDRDNRQCVHVNYECVCIIVCVCVCVPD